MSSGLRGCTTLSSLSCGAVVFPCVAVALGFCLAAGFARGSGCGIDPIGRGPLPPSVISGVPGCVSFPCKPGGGWWSFIHIEDAAAATVAAIERAQPGIYNVTDDEPAPVSVWLPDLAAAIGAPRPRRMPTWLARWFIGETGVVMMTELRGASNEKAKRELGWQPRFASWREGFRRGMG